MTTALYRRYRPESFAEVIGQDHVTAPLRQALRSGQANHAYLFSGPRGCGKTTSARILARCLNCAEGPTDTPCGVCPSCVELARGGSGSLDVVEIDAASHGGVDDARELRERATFAPARDRYKVFILDEAHMVSPQGFNALLKIVEEPPPHVKFIFATTEPDKVIGTIRSRTHHYPFRLVPPDVLVPYLEQLCAAEGVPVGAGVLSLVVRAGGGSVRDTLSVLDQLIAGSGDAGLEYEGAVALLGYTHTSLLDDLVDAVSARDGASAFRVVERVIATGHEPRRFVEDLLERLRDLIVITASGDAAGAVLRDVPADQLDRMRRQATHLGMSELSRSADLANAALTEMVGATSPRLHLELLMARLLLPSVDDSRTGLAARIDRLERGLPAVAPAGASVPGAAVPAPAVPAAAVPAAVPTAAGPAPATAGAAVPVPDAPAPGQAASEPAAPVRDAAASNRPVTDHAPTADAAGDERPRTVAAPDPDERGRGAAEPADRPTRAAAGTSQVADRSGGSAPAPAREPGSVEDGGRGAPAGAPVAPVAAPVPAPAPAPAPADPALAPAAPVPGAAAPVPGAAAAPVPGAAAAPVPGAAAAPVPGAAAAAADTEMLRRRWPDVLTTLRRLRLPSWALVNQHAQILELDATTLRLGFAQPGLVTTFRNSNHGDVVARALSETLGVTARVEAVLDEPGGSARSAPSSAPDTGPRAMSAERAAASWDEPAPAGPTAPAAADAAPAASPSAAATSPVADTTTTDGTRPRPAATSPGARPAPDDAPARSVPGVPDAAAAGQTRDGAARPVPPWESAPEGTPTATAGAAPTGAAGPRGAGGDERVVAHADDDIPPGDEPDDPWRDGPAPARASGGGAERGAPPARPSAPQAAPPGARPAPAASGGTARERGVAAARAAAAQSRGRMQEPDEPSPDDPTIGQSGLVGVPLVAQMLGGRVIDEQIDI
ncbi:DNA polymerase III subunit gamma and tau [Cellulomonas sp. zg-ZUI22]|uniref:DNA polymerase III subunit gamma and tau n=1 Tax=Cellulomonas sp. zg-ZUI22 TaxID=2816955 RepID=UPI001A948AA1|nr:DNA polymerase III subunit gamma and tau [Cellulomonas sp. zg-ZUI22]MBO0899104.1 DNA polymerase III subunit gamma and tau [Cellulomonas sp. zg-ZUI22]